MNISSQQLEMLSAKLLDGTITDAEYRQIEQAATAQPDFAQNLTELTHVENALNSLKNYKIAATPGLFDAVGNSISSKISAASASASVGSIIAGKMIVGYIVAGALGVAFLANVSYKTLMPHNPKAAASMNQKTIAKPQNNVQAETFASHNKLQSKAIATENSAQHEIALQKQNNSNIVSKSIETSVKNNPEQVNPTITLQNNSNSAAEIQAPDKSQRLMQSVKNYTALYEQANSAKNYLIAAENAKNLGLLYAKLDDAEKARLYFEHAATNSHIAGATETESEIYGQWALLEINKGNNATAKEFLNKAIRMSNGTNNTENKWQKELNKLVNSK